MQPAKYTHIGLLTELQRTNLKRACSKSKESFTNYVFKKGC